MGGGPVSPEFLGVTRLVRLRCPTRSQFPTESVPFAHITQVLEHRKHKLYVGNIHCLSWVQLRGKKRNIRHKEKSLLQKMLQIQPISPPQLSTHFLLHIKGLKGFWIKRAAI